MVSQQEKNALFSEYIKKMEEKARTGSSDIIPNGTIEHASVLIACLFSYAKKKINIFTGHLNPEVYASNEVMKSIKNVLNRKIKMEVLVQDSILLSEENKFLKFLKDKEEIFKIKEIDQKDRVRKNHFITIDDSAFRFEPDKNKPLGLGCFNSPDFVTQLNERFVEMFGRGKELIPE